MYSYKDIWKVSGPIMLGLLAQTVVQLTATIFLGLVGKVEQSASGLAGIYYIAFFTLCFGFSIGAQIMISRRNGEKSYKDIGTIVIQGIIFLEILAVILVTASLLLAHYALPHILHSAEVGHAMQEYLSWRIFGLFFASINVMFRAFFIGVTRTKVLTINAVIMAVVNIIADYAFIFGNLGMPQMGIKGAGLAAIIAELSSVLFFLIYTFATVDFKKYGFTRMRFRMSIIRNVLKISSFTMTQYLISMSTWFLFFWAMEKHSVDALAITNLVRNFYMLFFIPMSAFATAANTLVGNTMGMGQISNVIPLIKRVCYVALGTIAVIMGLTLIAPEYWVSLISPREDLSLIPQTVAPLLVVVFGLPICCLGSIIFNAVSGTGNTKNALYIEISVLVVYIAYILYVVIYLQASIAVCWTAELIYWGGLLVLSLLYFKFGKWQTKKV